MLLVKGLSRIISVPLGIRFDECVEGDQEFSHAGDDDDLEGFALAFEAFGKGLDDRIATSCGECGHVQDTADRGSSAPDGTFAMITSAVAIEGSQADQGRDFLSVEKTQFREIGQHRNDGDLADTGNGFDDVRFVFRLVVRFEKLGDLFFDAFDLLFQQSDHLLNALLDRLGSQQFLSIRFGRSQVDQLAASGDQLAKFFLFFCGFWQSFSAGRVVRRGRWPVHQCRRFWPGCRGL